MLFRPDSCVVTRADDPGNCRVTSEEGEEREEEEREREREVTGEKEEGKGVREEEKKRNSERDVVREGEAISPSCAMKIGECARERESERERESPFSRKIKKSKNKFQNLEKY